MKVLQDSEIHGPDAWKRDLIDAGWAEFAVTVWEDPEGRLWRGPYGAWCELQKRKRETVEDNQ